MFDPVWLGNYIVPRWEALLLIGGALVLSCLLAVGLMGLTIYAIQCGWRFARDYWRLMRGADLNTGCTHEWVETRLGHRHCQKCDEYQMLMENRYPEAGEAKYEWH